MTRVDYNEHQQQTDIGTQLQEARHRQRLTLDQAAESLHIRREYLAAIEENRWEALPGEVYGQGFLRSYARLLGLDAAQLVEIRRTQIGQTDATPPTPPPPRTVAPRPPQYADSPSEVVPSARRARRFTVKSSGPVGGSKGVVWLLLGLLALFVGGLALLRHPPSHATPVSSSPAPSATQKSSQSAKSTAPAKANPVAITVVSNNQAGTVVYGVNRTPVTVVLNFTGRCWVETWKNGVSTGAAGHIYDPGQTLTVSASQSVAVRLGNHYLTLTVNGKPLTLPGSANTVLQLTFQHV